MRLTLLAAGLLVLCRTVSSAQQNEIVRTLADMRAITGERVLVESVNSGIVTPRVTVRRGAAEASMTFAGAELENWVAEWENMVTANIPVGRDESAKNYSTKLGMEDHTFIQTTRLTERGSVTNFFTISDTDNRLALVAALTNAQALGLIRALRRAALLAQGRAVADAPVERERAARRSSTKPEGSVFTRCLAAARLQGRASDEIRGTPSQLQANARDANFQSICKSMPGIYLPELR